MRRRIASKLPARARLWGNALLLVLCIAAAAFKVGDLVEDRNSWGDYLATAIALAICAYCGGKTLLAIRRHLKAYDG
ncbi:hypothetical protein [Nonomuraea roseoviolacea]|uniref:hypothetical protein n=1 Tax=Nonomuraea roseoviolacea TaxID=103837 RepID=UPI0031DBA467